MNCGRMAIYHGAGCCGATWVMSDHIKVGKGLGFPVVALHGVGHMPAKGADLQDAARVFCVAVTPATQRSVIGWLGMGVLACG